MSSNVFGTPITAAEYPKREDRARVALERIEEGGKKSLAIEYLGQKKKEYGSGISALSMIYNATGENVYLTTSHDWHGKIYDDAPYPAIFQNGQWGAYLHVHPTGQAVGSEAGVVYNGTSETNEDLGILISWDIPFIGHNRTYTLIAKSGYFDDDSVWGDILKILETKGPTSSSRLDGLLSVTTITEGTSPTLEAQLSYTPTPSITTTDPST